MFLAPTVTLVDQLNTQCPPPNSMQIGPNIGGLDEMEFATNFPLHRACRDGDVQSVSLLLETNCHLATAEDRYYGWTPAHWAGYFGKLDCLRTVASSFPYGSSVNLQSSKFGQTPAHVVAQSGHPHCLLWLIQAGANPNTKDYVGETPLHKASRAGNTECVSLLIASGSDVRMTNNAGQTPSALAEMCGYPSVAAYISQVELSHELNGQNELLASGVRINGFRQLLPSGINGFGSHRNDQSFVGIGNIPANRKRSLNNANDVEVKRIRTEAPFHNNNGVAAPAINGTLHFTLSPLPPVTSSVVEHEKLCRMERGYTNALLECMINQFHGC